MANGKSSYVKPSNRKKQTAFRQPRTGAGRQTPIADGKLPFANCLKLFAVFWRLFWPCSICVQLPSVYKLMSALSLRLERRLPSLIPPGSQIPYSIMHTFFAFCGWQFCFYDSATTSYAYSKTRTAYGRRAGPMAIGLWQAACCVRLVEKRHSTPYPSPREPCFWKNDDSI